MAHDDNGGTGSVSAASSGDARPASSGTALAHRDEVKNPGMPEHHARVTDTDPKAKKRAERQVGAFFILSIVGSLFAFISYFMVPITPEDQTSVRMNTMCIGLGIAIALFGIGFGAVVWAKQVMSDHEMIDERHPVRSPENVRARAVEIFQQANEESGFGRRALIRNTLIGAMLMLPLPAVALFRDLYNGNKEDPVEALSHTMWKKGVRLTRDPDGLPIKAADVTIGSVFHIIPDGLAELKDNKNAEKALASVLLMRLPEDQLFEKPERKSWSYDGIVAYSKICTHVGCPVALYEQQTHHLLCPCHQSQFDVSHHCEVIFGPAKRPLPQLPITVDSEGYLVAQSDFLEPVGPSFWERKGDSAYHV